MSKSILTYSALSKFRDCRKAYDWRINHGLVPIGRDAKVYLGKVFHKALEQWYRLDLEGNAKNSEAIDRILCVFDSAYPERNSNPEHKRAWHLARAMFQAYIQRHLVENFHVVAVEHKFEAPIINPATGKRSRTFEMQGKVDLVVQMHGSGDYYIVEHKTAANITGDYIERLPLDFQVHLYSHYLSKDLGVRIAGVIYNVTGKAQIKQRQGETEQQFASRKADLIAKSRSSRSSAKRRKPETDQEFQARLAAKYEEPGMFHREELFISSNDVQRTISEVWQLTQQLLIARRAGNWYRNTGHCIRFNQKCEYFELCRSNDNPNIINNFFTQKPAHSELDEEREEEPVF